MATTTLGNKSTGSIIKLKENGTLVDFYVAKHDYESGLNGAGRTPPRTTKTAPTMFSPIRRPQTALLSMSRSM